MTYATMKQQLDALRERRANAYVAAVNAADRADANSGDASAQSAAGESLHAVGVIDGEIGALQAQMRAHEATMRETARPIEVSPVPGADSSLFAFGGYPGERKTLAKALAADAEFKRFRSGGSGPAGCRVVMEGVRIRAATDPILSPAVGAPPVYVGAVGALPRLARIRDVLTVVAMTGAAVSFAQETSVEGAPEVVPEGEVKPSMRIVTTPKTVAAKTVAVLTSVSNQVLADSPGFTAWIESRLTAAVLDVEDDYLVNDSADGLLFYATDNPAGAGLAGWANIRAAFAALEMVGDAPAAVLLNPLDYGLMEASVDEQGRPILAGAPTSAAAKTLFGVPVVTSPAIVAGTYIVVGRQGAVLYDRESIQVDLNQYATEYWTKNLTGVRIEERIALAVMRPASIIAGDLSIGST